MTLPRGYSFRSATLMGANRVKRTARSLSQRGALLDSRGNALRVRPGRYWLRVRIGPKYAGSITLLYRLQVVI